MPNWTYNLLAVEGEPSDLAALAAAVTGVDEDGYTISLDFEQHVPTPPEVLASDDWYHWRREHWGTKWNASDVARRGSPKEGRITYRFSTAWRPPDAWLAAVAAAHPSLEFHHEYVEELHHFAGEGDFRAGELVEHRERDPEERFWWLEYEPAYDEDWEELELDWAEIKRVTTFVVGVSERLANIRDLWMPTEDRLVLVYEQLGRAARAARQLGWADPDDVPAVEARDAIGGSVYAELTQALALAAGEALLASARLHQLDELRSTDDALRAEADEVAETISQNEDLSERGLLPLDWILHAFEWAAEARQSLRIRDRGSRGEPLHESLIRGRSTDGAQLAFQLVATECATALALFGPETIAIDDLPIPELDSKSAD